METFPLLSVSKISKHCLILLTSSTESLSWAYWDASKAPDFGFSFSTLAGTGTVLVATTGCLAVVFWAVAGAGF